MKLAETIKKIADENNFHYATLAAVAAVESSGSGFRTYKKLGIHPVIRFEPHVFNRYVSEAKKMPFTNCGNGFSKVASETGANAYIKARQIDDSAAILATSWGMFQLMGFHWVKLRYDSPQAFRDAMMTATGQYDAFTRFIAASRTLTECLVNQEPDINTFRTFARAYNGSSNVDAYSGKIYREYQKIVS